MYKQRLTTRQPMSSQPPGSRREQDELRPLSKLLPLDAIRYGISLWPDYVSCLNPVPFQPLVESFAENGPGSVQLCLSETINIGALSA